MTPANEPLEESKEDDIEKKVAFIFSYEGALHGAAKATLTSVDRKRFSPIHLEVFDKMVPKIIQETIIPELLSEPYASSVVKTVERINQHKRNITCETGEFGRDKERARQEVGRLFDMFTVEVLKAMENKKERWQRFLEAGGSFSY